MSAATLIGGVGSVFNFEHRMAHEKMLAASGPITYFSSVPFWIDPPFGDTELPSGWANSLHAQAHADFIGLFPQAYGGSGLANINDVTLYAQTDPWWQFSNFQLHYTANLAIP